MQRTQAQKTARSQANISQKKTILQGFFGACEKKIGLTPRIQKRKITLERTEDEGVLDSYFARIERAYSQGLHASSHTQAEVYHDLCSTHEEIEKEEQSNLNALLDQL